MIRITTVNDLSTYLADVRGDLTPMDRSVAVEALRAAVHPAWGSDWEQWLSDHRHLVDEALEGGV